MMKSISFNHFLRKVRKLALRFPVVLLITFIGTASAIAMMIIDMRSEYPTFQETLDRLAKVIMIALLAFPWVTLVTLMAERYQQNSYSRYLLQIVSALLISTYVFLFPADFAYHSAFSDLRLFLLTVAGTVLFLTLPFDNGDPQSLWRYLAASVRGAMTALVFAVGLGVGLTLSIVAIWYLFKIGGRYDDEVLVIIWQIMLGIIATWIFLSKLPSPKEKPSFEKLPQIIERFVSIIWLPIVVVFFVILYIYLGVILATWDWPDGGVIYWILAFSVVGIFSYILSYGNPNPPRWQKRYFQIFFASVLPIMVMYCIAIGLRIQQYGVTESRYLVVIGGLWLFIISFYYLISRAKKIQFIPYLTAIFLFLSVVGPWSMFSVSLSSQYDQLKELLVKNQLLVDGKITPLTNGTVSYQEYRSIKSMFDYIILHGKVEKIQPWFDEDLSQREGSLSEISSRAFEELSLRYDQREPTNAFYFNVTERKNSTPIDVRGFDFVYSDIYLSGGTESLYAKPSVPGFSELQLTIGSEVTIEVAQVIIDQKPQTIAVMNLSPLISKFINQYGMKQTGVDPSEFVFDFENEKVKFKMLIDRLGGQKTNDTFSLEYVTFTLLGFIK